MVAEKEIRKVLSQVVDPEIPVLTIEEMGILDDVKIIDNRINIFILPTYNGCPAMDLIKMEISSAMYDAGYRNFNIHLKQSPPWTTERMSIKCNAPNVKVKILCCLVHLVLQPVKQCSNVINAWSHSSILSVLRQGK